MRAFEAESLNNGDIVADHSLLVMDIVRFPDASLLKNVRDSSMDVFNHACAESLLFLVNMSEHYYTIMTTIHERHEAFH